MRLSLPTLVCTSVVLAGCVTISEAPQALTDSYKHNYAPPAGYARVYVVPEKVPYESVNGGIAEQIIESRVFVSHNHQEEVPVGLTSYEHFVAFDVRPGDYTIKSWTGNRSTTEWDFHFSEGKTVVLQPQSRFQSGMLGLMGATADAIAYELHQGEAQYKSLPVEDLPKLLTDKTLMVSPDAKGVVAQGPR